ncbi:AAA family ATPase [Anaerolineales bacterium HSG24]|nr:AAA family ATPase [Anaerolineales bacterium HSG24]
MTIRIDVTEFFALLKFTPPEQNIMLIGRHGIGKSEIITGYYRQHSQRVVSFFLGQMSDPGDLIGLMHKDEETGRSVFLPPYWWPNEDEPIVLFLDELNRARPEILQAVQDLTLNKTLAGKKLPKGSMVIAAVNEGDEYQLTELDPALVSRFNLYEFAPTVEDWLLWANNNQIDTRVINFIQKNHHQLDGETAKADEAWQTSGLVKTPDRRAWVKLSNFIKPHRELSNVHLKIMAGIVGTSAAVAFRQSLAAMVKITPQQLLLRFNSHYKKLEKFTLPELILLNEQIVFWIDSQNYKPNQTDTVQKNLLAYVRQLQKLKQNEALAHFATMANNDKFAHLKDFAGGSMELMMLLIDYVQGIEV